MNYQLNVRLNDTDAARRLFFANQFVMAHEAWEACLDKLGLSIASILDAGSFVLPIVHAEADYSAPVALGDQITVSVTCDRIGEKSFSLAFALRRDDGTEVGTVSHVHASVDAETGEAVPLPPVLRDVLTRLNNED